MILYSIVFLFLTSFILAVSKSIHISANGTIPFLFVAEPYSIVYRYHIIFIHSSVDGHLGCFHVLAVINSAAVNTGEHVSFWIMVLSSCMPKIGIAGSYGSSTFRKSTSFHAQLHFFFSTKTPMYSSFLKSFLSVIMDSSPLYCPWIKHKSQLLGCAFFQHSRTIIFYLFWWFLIVFQYFPFQISLLIYRHL